MNPVEIEEGVSQLAAEPFDRAEFPFQFLAAFGNKPTTIQRLRAGATNVSDIDGGVLQRGNIHIATCAPGDVDATLKALRDSPRTASAKAKFILATDGEAFQAEDLSGTDTVACAYTEFPDRFSFFLPLAGITTVAQIRESAFDIRATARLNKLYMELLKDNPEWASRQRTTPWIAGIGPLSTISTSARRWASLSRDRLPGALPSSRPSGPRALNRTTQSRTICKPTPPIRAAAVRLPPS